jgi:hypothetical protein
MRKRFVLMSFLFVLLSISAFSQTSESSLVRMTESINRLDQLVEDGLKKHAIKASDICPDETFCRRLSLDITGRIPSSGEVRQFIKDSDPEKRSKLIDRMIGSENFVDFQVLKWGDLLRCKSEFASNLWPNAVQAYARWMRESIRNNLPYDQFARALLLSSGSNFRSPEVNFYRAFQQRDTKLIAESAGLIFLGMRPASKFSGNKSTGDLSPFFTQLKYKKSDEWKEEIVFINKDIPPVTYEVIMPGGEKVLLKDKTDFRISFADWLTDKPNPYFAKVMANRVWFWLMGRGIVNQPDDFGESNPPSNPALLSFLENEFIAHNYDMKYLFRLILNARTYQRSAVPNNSNRLDDQLFSHHLIHRLTAEQLLDAICDITGVNEIYSSRVPEPYTFLPKDTRAVQLEDGTISTPFLEMFGRPSRDISYESDRDNNLTMKQVLHLLNSSQISGKIAGSKKLKQLTDEAPSKGNLIEEIYLLVLNRFPKEQEIATILTFDREIKKDKYQLTFDLVWALINTKEFVFNH